MVRATCILASCALIALLLVVPSSAYPRYPSYNNYYRDDAQYEPEDIMNMLDRLQNLLQLERKMEKFAPTIVETPNYSYNDAIISEKRALDLGLNRGYSGAIQAKHMLGVSAANSAFGPGRRRRDAH